MRELPFDPCGARNTFYCKLLAILCCAIIMNITSLRAAELPSAAANAINSLGVDLLHRVGMPDENALISPYSIQSALVMAYAGADGTTRDEMAKVLHYPKDESQLHQSFAALRKTLNKAIEQSELVSARERQYGQTNAPLTLVVANRLFGQRGYDFREPFLTLLKDNYSAPFEDMDFINRSALAKQRINEWVEDQTRKRIRDLIPDGALGPLTRLVLVNAIYLKAPWAEKFEASATKPGLFHVNGGKGVEVPMMSQRKEFLYRKGNGFSVVRLPYNYQFVFLIILPDNVNGLATLEAKLSPGLNTELVKFENCDVTLHLPKFKLEPPMMPLSQTLQALGMKSAFDHPRGSADFERMAPRKPDDYLALSEVFHKTFLKLDEEGTEAAAATALTAIAMGIHEPPKPVEMNVDHPFIFAIRHEPTRAILFLGHVTDPR